MDKTTFTRTALTLALVMAPGLAAAGVSAEDKPIIGGQGKYKYQYMPDLLKVRCRASSSSVRIGAGARLVGARG